MSRIYEALVYGVVQRPDLLMAMGRHHTQRTKMTIRDDGKPAVTHYRAIQTFSRYTRLELALELDGPIKFGCTCSTWVIVIGDPTYGGISIATAPSARNLKKRFEAFQGKHCTHVD